MKYSYLIFSRVKRSKIKNKLQMETFEGQRQRLHSVAEELSPNLNKCI